MRLLLSFANEIENTVYVVFVCIVKLYAVKKNKKNFNYYFYNVGLFESLNNSRLEISF